VKLYCLVLVCAAGLGAQTFVVQGDVVNSMTGAPIAGAQVAIRGMLGSNTQSAVVCGTDSAGHFQTSFPMPVVSAVISVNRTGFAGKSIAIVSKRDENRPPLRIAITPQGVLSGKVLDQDGFPAEGTRIEALHYTLIKGERKLMGGNSAVVNDLGEYRIPLMPGSYYVRAVPSGKLSQWDSRYGPQYYGSGWEPRAENRVTIEAGQGQTGIDLHLISREGVSISGSVVMPDAAPGGTSMPSVGLESLDDRLAPGRYAMPDRRDGSFALRHVPPGKWLLRIPNRSTRVKAGDLVAEQILQVADTDIREVALSPRAAEPRELSGTLVFQGTLQPRTVVVGLRSGDGGPVTSTHSNDDGSFTLRGLLPGHYHVDLQATISDSLAGVFIGHPVAVQLGDQEVLHQEFDIDESTAGPLRITLTNARGTLDGKLLDKAGQPVAGAHLMLYGDWCKFSMTTDAAGSFHYDELFPGEYYIVPAESPNSDDAQDAGFPPVHLVEGANPPVVLTLQ
jgi:hypothetical protein